jgi:hypothetical protein
MNDNFYDDFYTPIDDPDEKTTYLNENLYNYNEDDF